MSIPIFVINMNKSVERWNYIRDYFLFDELTRFEAVEGIPSDDSDQRTDRLKMLPTEIACTQSHINVWQKIVDDDIPMAIILEDDVKPVDDKYSIASIDYSQYLPFDVLFLQVNFGGSCIADDNNNYVCGKGAHAYLITKRGAEKSIEALNPMLLLVDSQWPLAFEHSQMFTSVCKPTKNIKAKVLKNGIIEHSPMARTTTFTTSGDKSWTDGWFKGGYK